jgi:hypothetical protein
VLALHRMPVLSLVVLWCWHLLDGGDDQAPVGVGRAAPAVGRIAAAPDEGFVRLEKSAQRAGSRSAVAQLVRHGPRPSGTTPPLVPAAETGPRRRVCRGPSGRPQ